MSEFGCRISNTFGPECHVIAEGYKFVLWLGGEISLYP